MGFSDYTKPITSAIKLTQSILDDQLVVSSYSVISTTVSVFNFEGLNFRGWREQDNFEGLYFRG